MDEKQRETLRFKGENLFLQVSQYRSNGRIAVMAYTEEEPYSDITTNLPGMCLDEDEGAIDSLARSCGLEKTLIKKGIIKEVYGTTRYNMGTYDIVAFNMEELRKYDPEGVKQFEETLQQDEEEID